MPKIFKKSPFVDGSFDQVDVRTGTHQGGANIASTSIQIDDRFSTGNVTILSGETAMLACKIYNLGNKSVSIRMDWYIFCYINSQIRYWKSSYNQNYQYEVRCLHPKHSLPMYRKIHRAKLL